MKVKYFVLWFLLLLVGKVSYPQSTDSIVLPREYEPEWKFNSFGISARLIKQYYLTDYTIEDAKRNILQISGDEEYFYDNDSISLFRRTSLVDRDEVVYLYGAVPKGLTVNVAWKKKEKPNEVRLSFFLYDYEYLVIYGHSWVIAPDTVASLTLEFREAFTIGGLNLQYIKHTKPFFKDHLRVYSGFGFELGSDLGSIGATQQATQTYKETRADTTLYNFAARGALSFSTRYFNYASTSTAGSTKMRLFGGLNLFGGFEILFKKRIKAKDEKFSIFGEYGFGLDGEILIRGSKMARWTQQTRFGLRYFLK